MNRLIKIIMLSAAAMIIFASGTLAKAPTALVYTNENKITVSGSFEEVPENGYVNILALKKSADYTSFSVSDILYIESTQIDANGNYSFTFDMIDYQNANIYIKTQNIYLPVTTFNTIIDEDITDIAWAEIEIDENVITTGVSKNVTVYAKDKEQNPTSYDSCTFYGYDERVISVDDGTVTGKNHGDTELYAIVSKNGKSVKTDKIRISVRDNAQIPAVTGAAFKSNGKILDITGDISTADEVVFSFDKGVSDISGVRVENLSNNTVRAAEGFYDVEQLTYTINLAEELGYSKYKFKVLSDTQLAKSEIIEGCVADFNIPQTIAADKDYIADFNIYNCRGYKINCEDLQITGTENGVLRLSDGQTEILRAEFTVNGQKRSYQKEIKALAVGEIIVGVERLRMEKGETQKVRTEVYAADGSLLEIKPDFSVSGSAVAISPNGILTVRNKGVATVSVSLGNITKKFKIGVGYDAGDDLFAGRLIDARNELEIGEKQALKFSEISLLGNITELQNVTFTSSDESVAAIENNIITAKNYGKTQITAEYDGNIYKKIIFVVPEVTVKAEIELKSSALPVGKYDVVKVLVNFDRYLTPGEYELISDDESVIKVGNNTIYGVGKGKTLLFARVKTEGGYIDTEPVEVTVFESMGGYFIDDIDNTDKIFDKDSRLVLNESYGELYTNGIEVKDAYVIYKTEGNINNFTVYDHLCQPFDREDLKFYLSEDNRNYTEITDVTRFEGSPVNGWVVDAVMSGKVTGNYKYLKIVMNNSGNTQATRLDRVEIAYSTNPEVLDLKIVDDCNDDEIYKNVLGKKAIVTFDQPINADTLSNVKVSGENVSEGMYDSDLFRYEFKLPDVSESNYNIEISNVTEAFGKANIAFNAAESALDGTYTAQSQNIYEISPDEGGKRILIKNNTVLPKTYIVFECEYNNGKLVGARQLNNGRIDSASEKYVYVNYQKGNHKLFVWDSLQSMKPLADAE